MSKNTVKWIMYSMIGILLFLLFFTIVFGSFKQAQDRTAQSNRFKECVLERKLLRCQFIDEQGDKCDRKSKHRSNGTNKP